MFISSVGAVWCDARALMRPPMRLGAIEAAPCSRNEASVVVELTLYSSRYSVIQRMRPLAAEGESEPNTSS